MKSSTTVFTYDNGKTTLSYQNHTFDPIYLDEVDATVKTEAEQKCGGQDFACVFDFIATKDEEFAKYSASVNREANKVKTVQSKLSLILQDCIIGNHSEYINV